MIERNRATYMAAYFFFWLSYFIFFKAVFLLYHQALLANGGWQTVAGIFLHGLRLDLSITAGICLFPFLLTSLSAFTGPVRWLRKSLNYYTCLLIFLFTLLCTSDLELFRIWGFRLDASPLLYLNTPQEMVVSVGAAPLWLLIILNVLVNLFFSQAYRQLLHPITAQFEQHSLRLSSVNLLAPLLLLTLLPASRRSAYFSEQHFANQAALNVSWNFFYALARHTKPTENAYRYMPELVADSLVNQLYPSTASASKRLLKSKRPNIVLIIWESLTAKAVEKLGGIAGVTPQLDALSDEGILFTNFYASGDRSDKGLVAILSGRPALPTVSLLARPEKAAALPQLSHSLQKAGYQTAFYYGGDLNFAKLSTYLQQGGFDQLVSVKYFPEAERNSQWGAHDEVVFRRLLQDIEEDAGKNAPFFKVMFTLSSHEPFDFPGESRFKDQSTPARFLSSLAYTDSTFGAFIQEARQQDWYEQTLFIVVADHGHTYPGRSPVYSKEKFHVPMLWFGGALNTQPATLSRTASQTDLAATLLGQLALPADEFRWSRDLFSLETPAFAHYFFKEGVGQLTDSSYLSFDHVGQHVIEQEGDAGRQNLHYAKAYLQQSFGDYLNN